MFNVKWFRLRIHEPDPNRTIVEHANTFTMVDTRNIKPGSKPYVLASECEWVLYINNPSKVGLSYVVRYDPK